MMLFQTTERETRKRLRLLFFFVISFPFPYLFFGPLFPSLLFQKQSPCPRFFYILPPLSVPFLYFFSLSKLLSTSPKSHLFPFCFTLFSLSFFEILPHPSISSSPPVFIGSRGRGPPYPVQAQGKAAWGDFCIAAPGHGSLSFLYHVGRV